MSEIPPAPQQPVQPPAPQSVAEKQSNPVALVGFIIAIVAFLFAVIPVLSFIAWLPAIAAIVLTIVGLALKGRKKLFAAIGLPIAVVAIIVGIIVSVVTGLAAVSAGINEVQKTASAKAAEPLTVVYSARSTTGTIGNVTYSTYTGNNSGTEQAANQPSPWSKQLDLKRGGDFDYKSFLVIASAGADGGDVTCSITVNGKEVSTQTSSGAFASATCNVSGTDLDK